MNSTGVRWLILFKGNGRKLTSAVALLALLLTLFPALPAVAGEDDSQGSLSIPAPDSVVGEVSSVVGRAYDPDGVSSVRVAIQNSQGEYLQDPFGGGWSNAWKSIEATITGWNFDSSVGGDVYEWSLGVAKAAFPEDTYKVYLYVLDQSGNFDDTVAGSPFTFQVDATGPVLSDPVPADGAVIAGSGAERFAVTATDVPAGVEAVQLVYKIGDEETKLQQGLTQEGDGVYAATVDLSGTTVGDVVYYYFTAEDNAGNSSRLPADGWYAAAVDKVPPGEVTGLTVEAPAEGGQLVLSWTDPDDGDYAGARVYYKTIEEENWTPAAEVEAGVQTYTITDLDSSGEIKYAVKVTTRDGFGNESEGTIDDNNGQGYAARDIQPPAEVSDLTVSIVPAGGSLELQWTDPDDGDYAGAKVYYRKLNETDWTYFGTVFDTVTGAVYVTDLANGTPYAVKVTTVDVYDNESDGVVADNNGQGYIPTDTQAPGEVTVVDVWAEPSGGTIELIWDDPKDLDLNHVNVYIREKGSDTWNTPAAVAKNVGWYEFTGLDRTGQTAYEFKITTVDAVYNESPGFELNNGGQGYTAKDETPPGEVTNVEVTIPAEGNSLEVSWDDPFDEDLDHINVYYRPIGTPGDAWLGPLPVDRGVERYLITGLANGHAYEVKLTAVDDVGNESSGVEENYFGHGYLPKQTAVDTTAPGEVTDLTVKPAPGAGRFILTLTTPEDEDLAGVAVYTALSGSDEWVLSEWLSSDMSETSEIAVQIPGSFVLGSDKVQFKVTTLDVHGNESEGVVADNGGQGYPVLGYWELTPGPEGWATFSVPVQLAGNQALLGDVINPEDVEIAYKFDAANQQWVQVTTDNNTLEPLEAVYIKLKKGTLAGIKPTTAPTNPPVKDLAAGWNLIGFTDNRPLSQALSSVDRLWSVAVSPAVNPDSWATTWNGYADYLVDTHYGYWVYMDEEGKLAGLSTTPVTVGRYPYPAVK
ncbi:fibronectin type III domain-containing protein [Calderihabitans maritimus]|uniref:Minor extracellular protease epr n=1 Tax=Calderihabitans maritimus TaxID=1246530 RepID=A0A1Z5HPF2_9FIRM|nr:fibronectin type III domain-containing protein [Calderihabitans maritimus]GAW91175.1 Minor extracellular protease epr [Calderihabitans maritimus]